MAVIISNGDTDLSTASGFYRVEAYNLNPYGDAQASGASIVIGVSGLTTGIPVTFANTGNCLGVVLWLNGNDLGTSAANGGVWTSLQEIDATNPTITIASPAVVTITGHSYLEGQTVSFNTTGTLPTGIVTNTTYYVRNPTANTFTLATTAGGTEINTSGSQSGTHTLWADRATKQMDIADITSATNYRLSGDFIVPFTFTSSYAVDTTASKWRFRVHQVSGTTGTWRLSRSVSGNNAYVAHATWCDNAVSFTNGDTVICKDIVTIDQSATFGGVTQSGATNNSPVCCVVTRSMSPSVSTVKLQWENPPASSYTLTLEGHLQISSHGGFAIGSSASKIPYAQQAIVDMSNASAQITGVKGSAYSGNQVGKLFIYMFGAVPTKTRKTTFTGAIAAGATSMTTAESTGWASGDIISIGRRTTKNASSTRTDRDVFTVSSSSGTTVNFSPAIPASQGRSANGVTCLMNGYGVSVTNASGTGGNGVWRTPFTVFQIDGVEFKNIQIVCNVQYSNLGYSNPNFNGGMDTDFTDDCYIKNSTGYYSLATGSPNFFGPGVILPAGFTMDSVYLNNYRILSTIGTGPITFPVNWFTSGEFVMNNCVQTHTYFGSTSESAASISGNMVSTITNNIFENGEQIFLSIYGARTQISGNTFWGCNGGNFSYGALQIQDFFASVDCGSNYFDNNVVGLYLQGRTTVDVRFSNDFFSTISANTTDITVAQGGFNDVIMDTPTLSTISTSALSGNIFGSRLRFTNYNNTANDDRVYSVYGNLQRTGTSLTDTTVHTAGGYAIRLEPLSSTTNLEWQFTIPTGDIEDLTMQVGVWCKINSATYYAGTHQLPRLTVDYDNGTTTYAQATSSTSWQFLSVPFTPTTGYGEITVTLSGRTDATSTNAYVYFDDFSTLYPANAPLNTQTFDLWADAYPVTPPIATVLSAFDVWNVAKSTQTTAGTMGNHVSSKLLTVAKFLGLK